MNIDKLKRDIARQFGTPAVVIDLDVVERNIARVQAMLDAAGIQNRPHIKTHKSPVLARLQSEGGASGITCQKLGEAEVMAEGGLEDIFISYNLLGEEKLRRLARLMQRARITVAADNPVVVQGLGEMDGAGRKLDVLVECDTGRKRAGVETPREAIQLAREIASRPALNFAGFMIYPPETAIAETQSFLDEAVQGVREAGLDVRVISNGGTPNLANLGKIKGVTEHRAGTSIFNDRMMMACGAAKLEDCALSVYATVVSRAASDRGILDSGSKTLTSDKPSELDGYGAILEYPQARIPKFSEEHGFLDLSGSNRRPEIGEVVRIIPNHVCVVVNMVDRFVTVRGDEIVGELPVAARGKLA